MNRELVASGLLTVAIGLTFALMSRDWLYATWASDPVSAAGYSLAMLALGYFAARAVCFWRESRLRKSELKALSVRIAQLPLGEKLLVKLAYEGRSNRMRGQSADSFHRHSAEPLEGIVYAVPHEMGAIELKLTDEAREAVEAHTGCLDAVPWP